MVITRKDSYGPPDDLHLYRRLPQDHTATRATTASVGVPPPPPRVSVQEEAAEAAEAAQFPGRAAAVLEEVVVQAVSELAVCDRMMRR